MKKIFYFTGTGNSLYIAQKLAEGIGDVELVAIKDEIKKESIVIDCDFFGIVYPVYCFGIPRIVRDFLVKADIRQDSFIFCVANAGGPKFAPSNGQVEKILKKKGVVLNSGFVVGMPGNYIPMYGAPNDNKLKKIIESADIKIDEIINCVKNKKCDVIERGFFLIRFGYRFADFFYKSLSKAAKNYYATDKCNSCGKCVSVCPVGNIHLENGKPVWGDNCEQCMACLQYCPTEAIEYGKISIGRKRYRNPFVKL
jgi:NAD-dependent dihydropyrimidine dehydrogenase PreA subunit/flavodoxin